MGDLIVSEGDQSSPGTGAKTGNIFITEWGINTVKEGYIVWDHIVSK